MISTIRNLFSFMLNVNICNYHYNGLLFKTNDLTNPVNDAVKSQANKGIGTYDAVNDVIIKRLVQEVLLILNEGGKGIKDLMAYFNVARATIQRDMALLKAHQFIEFKGSPKTGVYTLTEKFKKQIEEIK